MRDRAGRGLGAQPGGQSRLPRYAAEVSFPPYAFVPGQQWPHPTRDPAGHRLGSKLDQLASFDPERWHECRPYLFGIDLFNHGYYWEAHEVWESLWHACGRKGTTGDFIRALILLAAAGVKAREGRPVGVCRHAAKAESLLRRLADELGSNAPHHMGLGLHELCAFTAGVAEGRRTPRLAPGARLAVVFEFVLRPA